MKRSGGKLIDVLIDFKKLPPLGRMIDAGEITIERKVEPVEDYQVCQMCHSSSGCQNCCNKCKKPCNAKQHCGLTDTMERKQSRWEILKELENKP